ncbi:Sulfurtransferase TusE [Candidatus Providencia siddallii]|uniref:Sulfurtransferase n=1 Tax=Candidatus Providencia siddallii TaxID=1715285 RepID=A0A0M6W8M9_9GAMM|nr:Sulfurtransferase TusE [Candidatus Providencia siddallii]
MPLLNSKEILTDSQGYLINSKHWNEEIIYILAEYENIKLTNEHLEIIKFIRIFYTEFNIPPSIRILVKTAKKKFGKKKGNSSYLYKLFPKGPAIQAIKLAGLPKQIKCI